MTEILRLLVIVSLLLSIFDLGSEAQSTTPNAVMRDVEEIMHSMLLPDGGCDTILLDHDTHVQDGSESKRYACLTNNKHN